MLSKSTLMLKKIINMNTRNQKSIFESQRVALEYENVFGTWSRPLFGGQINKTFLWLFVIRSIFAVS